jgi:DNA-binding NarL/FixJ family response regulator
LQDGVYGCVLTTASPTEFVKGIRVIYAGEFRVPRKLLARVVKNLRWHVDELEGSPAELRDVFDREHEVVIWAVQRMTSKEIIAELSISAKPMKTHLQTVFR